MMGSILDARSPTYVGGISSSYAPCANNYIMIEPRTATFFSKLTALFCIAKKIWSSPYGIGPRLNHELNEKM